jgi:geranylgeranyl pyrophosphate synthase
MSTSPADASVDIAAYLASEVRYVEPALERALAGWAVRIAPTLMAAMRHGVLSGGKRLRPILCATAYRAAGGKAEASRIHDLAASLEMIHAYSLMHDDLPSMDDAELRRGRPTTHREHGVHAATMGGLLLIPMAGHQAYQAALELGRSSDEARVIAGLLCEAAGSAGMVGGQALDLLGEGRALASAELDELHRRKTGALLTASLTVGALAAGAAPPVVDALTAYGKAVGLAFQVADDVLDATSTAEQLGKRPSDAEHDKSTYVSLHGLEEARRRAGALVDEACSHLSAMDAPELIALARYVIERRR